MPFKLRKRKKDGLSYAGVGATPKEPRAKIKVKTRPGSMTARRSGTNPESNRPDGDREADSDSESG